MFLKWSRMLREIKAPDATANHVLRVIASYADEAGDCWPALSTLADQTQLDKSTVCRALERLAKAKLIERQRSKGMKSTKYRLTLSQPATDILSHTATDGDQTVAQDNSTVADRHSTVAHSNQAVVQRDTKLPRRTKEGTKKDLLTASSEPLPAAEPEDGMIVATLKLSGKGKIQSRNITEREVKEWQPLYPAVDVLAECSKMAGWCLGNPTKRKTAQGIDRFIQAWLAREQDKSRTLGGAGPPRPRELTRYERDMQALRDAAGGDSNGSNSTSTNDDSASADNRGGEAADDIPF